ncbi:MAG: GNAT family N-acetyltransferase [Aphanothece sp. CMT-3BRIN-NPC111]|jgi:RimJ/RimL family protein N-acetyltransferase|nr:GNAT family N-acetyltransferase [Aphanothece sp. CMT-3BRIN-NPC111]
MAELPTLLTERLLLRPFTLEDAPFVQRLAGAREIADTTISIPHPYEYEYAEKWIAGHENAFVQGTAIHFAIEIKDVKQLIGAIELRDIDIEQEQAELSYWIGVEWWGKGFASEAAQCLLRYGFEHIHLNRIYAYYMLRNPASGRVLQKVGMRQEGLMRQRVRKWGIFEDVVLYAILYTDWLAY